MDIKKFWEIIDNARKEDGEWEKMCKDLIKILAKLEISEIMIWRKIFDEYQKLSYKKKLWAAAYLINSGCSDDAFDYFRAWLIAQGKTIFMKALHDPDALAEAESVNEELEIYIGCDMFGITADAYFRKSGIKDSKIKDSNWHSYNNELEKYSITDELKKEMISEIDQAKDIDIEWEDDDLEKLLPKLFKKFDW